MYIVLAGGFYGASHKQEIWGYVPENVEDRGVDFIVNIDGLPEELLKLDENPARYRWHCNRCKRFVPEWEMERKYGCAMHDPEPQKIEQPQGRDGVMEEYKLPRLGLNTIRIWIDNGQGRQRWMDIARYVKAIYPASKSLSTVTPRPVGNRYEFKITKEDIPTIDLAQKEGGKLADPVEEVRRLKAELEVEINKMRAEMPPAVRNHAVFKCDKCDFESRSFPAYRAHCKKAHGVDVATKKDKKDGVQHNSGNSNTTSSLEDKK